MKEAMGGLFSIVAIVVFLIIVNCFLAFTVNYTRAFRAKNEIRSIVEKYEGLTPCAVAKIEEFLNRYHYHLNDPSESWCNASNNWKVASGRNNTPLFCYRVEKVDVSGGSNDNMTYKGAYYTIATFVNIDIPIFNRIYGGFANVFMVKGETALIYSSGVNFEVLDKGVSATQCNVGG